MADRWPPSSSPSTRGGTPPMSYHTMLGDSSLISVKTHPPRTVLPKEAGHQGGRHLHRLGHLLHQNILQPLDGSAPPASLEGGNKIEIKSRNEVKMLREEQNCYLEGKIEKEEVTDTEAKAKDNLEEDKKKKPARNDEEVAEEKQEECVETYLLRYKPETDPTVRLTATSSLSRRPGDPSTLLTSSSGTRSFRTTSVGSQGARGLTRGTPSGDNIDTLSLVGGDCQATIAAYNCTQFGDHGVAGETDRYAWTNRKARSSTNLENTTGLADVNQRAVAIPRGDCNKKEYHPSEFCITMV